MIFKTDYSTILKQIQGIDPVKYANSRNYIDGSVTYLSPYISRGVISTKQVMKHILTLDFNTFQIEKILQELAWRDYWQQIWIDKKSQINHDLKQPQSDVKNQEIPEAIVQANTGITAIDRAIENFYNDGYLHNHIRMYIASLACNLGKSHWFLPAQWMYYHLIDGDWASNALSWQWVAGANANKKYFANQENINKYCYTAQKNTFLDVPYSELTNLKAPKALSENISLNLETPLPGKTSIHLTPDKPMLIYNYYNLDPTWRTQLDANRVLLIEPRIFKKYPVSRKSLDFMLGLSKNIKGIQVYVGDFEELLTLTDKVATIYFKEHPLNSHYKGKQDARDWMFSVQGYYPSFFKFWKKCKKEWLSL